MRNLRKALRLHQKALWPAGSHSPNGRLLFEAAPDYLRLRFDERLKCVDFLGAPSLCVQIGITWTCLREAAGFPSLSDEDIGRLSISRSKVLTINVRGLKKLPSRRLQMAGAGHFHRRRMTRFAKQFKHSLASI
jgi:hypothetical protein